VGDDDAYFLSAATIPLLLAVRPPADPWVFSMLFGFAMGADYLLVPLMAAEQFGLNSLPRAMASFCPPIPSARPDSPPDRGPAAILRELYTPLYIVFGVGILSGILIALMPQKEKEPGDGARRLPRAGAISATG